MAEPKPKPRASKTAGTEAIYVRLPLAVVKKLTDEAGARMIDRSVIVEKALAEFLPKLVPVAAALETVTEPSA